MNKQKTLFILILGFTCAILLPICVIFKLGLFGLIIGLVLIICIGIFLKK